MDKGVAIGVGFKYGVAIMTILAKEKIKKVLNSLPDDSTYDKILRELSFNRMVERGLEDSKNNKVISNEQMKQKIVQWQK